MKSLRILVLALAMLALGPAFAAPAANPVLRVDVVRDGQEFAATFHFPQAAPAWAFVRSNLARRTRDSWRLQSWMVKTPGVRLERRGDFDVLSAANGNLPKQVVVRFKPFANDLLADYDPALQFSDGSVALFTGHFAAGPWIGTGTRPEGEPPRTTVSFKDPAGPLLYKGISYRTATTDDLETYVVFGKPKLLETESLSGIIDPQVPGWLRGELLEFLPHSIALYRQRLGPPGGTGKPMVLVSWAGPTPLMVSQGGSVLPNLLAIRLEGYGLVERSPEELQRLRWFIAHESAHFWLGQAVMYDNPGEAWITEGGANLLGYRLIEKIDPSYHGDTELSKDFSDCVALAGGKAIANAGSRQEYRAYYACGAVFALVAEGAAQKKQRDYFDFVRDLVAANRRDAGGDGKISMAEWLAALTRESGDPSIARDIRAMLVDGVADPQALLTSLLKRVGRKAPG